jgi:hypothetical protein
LAALRLLGDDVVDVFCAVLALAIDQSDGGRVTQPFYVDPDDILRLCQRKMSNRAYTPDQRAAVISHLNTLARPVISGVLPNPRRSGRELRFEHAILDLLGDIVGEYDTLSGERLWQRRQIKIGDWARLAPPLSGETAVMLRSVLAYHARRERTEKRLGRFLTLQFRLPGKHERHLLRDAFSDEGASPALADHHAPQGIASRGRAALTMRMDELLAQAGIQVDSKNPGRFAAMVEDALARLRRDGVIGDYSRIIDSTPYGQRLDRLVTERAQGWWAAYARQEWRIERPHPPALELPPVVDDQEE